MLEKEPSRTGAGFRVGHRHTLAIGLLGLLVGACGPQGPATDAGADGDVDAGTTPVCGDGVVDAGELCDDGNRVAGDGCSPDCVPSGMPYDCVDLLERNTTITMVRSVLALSDGAFMVGGEIRYGGPDTRAWIARYDRSGAQQWLEELTFADESSPNVIDLATDGPNGAWALVTTSSVNRLVRFGAQGTVVSTTVLTTAGGFKGWLLAIESTSAGVWIAGSISADSLDAWLGLYDPETGTMTDLVLEDHLGYDDWAMAIGRSDDEVAVALKLSTESNFYDGAPTDAPSDAVVVHFDLLGNELRRTLLDPSPDPKYSRVAYGVTADTSGRWFVSGLELRRNDFPTAKDWIAPVQPKSSWNWTSGEAEADRVSLAGLVGVDEGVLAVGGRIVVDDLSPATRAGWVASFAADGSMRWEFSQADDVYGKYRYLSVINDSEGRFRAVGHAEVSSNSSAVRSCLIAY